MNKFYFLALVLLFSFGAGGCASITNLVKGSDPVSGSWSGDWYVNNMPKPGGKLRCEVERIARDEWKAVFEAEFGQTAAYKVELLGKRDGKKVVFGGDVDLGAASGGVFTWTGDADGEKFNGVYKSKFYGGHFEMKRVEAKTP